MVNFIIRRLIMSVFLALALIAIVFFALRTIVPGDPILLLAGERAKPQQIEAIRRFYGLDKPIFTQFLIFLQNLFKGEMGISIMNRQAVTERVLGAYPTTLRLTLYCFILEFTLGIFVGVVTAYWHDTWLDNIMRIMTVASASLPTFWLGIMLILIFCVLLGWFPTQGDMTNFKGAALPTITLGIGSAAFLSRLVRGAMLEVLNSDYIRTARAKGLIERLVVIKHALRNSLIPIITVAGFSIGGLLGGAVITENIFNLNGMGSLTLDAINNRDYPVIQGTVLFVAFAYLFINLLVDVTYAYVDPRIRYD